jgi:hypothetical protein
VARAAASRLAQRAAADRSLPEPALERAHLPLELAHAPLERVELSRRPRGPCRTRGARGTRLADGAGAAGRRTRRADGTCGARRPRPPWARRPGASGACRSRCSSGAGRADWAGRAGRAGGTRRPGPAPPSARPRRAPRPAAPRMGFRIVGAEGPEHERAAGRRTGRQELAPADRTLRFARLARSPVFLRHAPPSRSAPAR